MILFSIGYVLYSYKLTLFFLSIGYVIYSLIYRFFLWPYVLSPLRNVPGPSIALPDSFFGPLFWEMVKSEPGILHREWAKEHGPAVRVIGPLGVERVIILSPTALHKVLVSDWLEYPRPSYMRQILGSTAGYGLLTVTGDVHRQMRKTMNPAFSLQKLMAQTDMYYEPIYGLVEILRAGIRSEEQPAKGKVFQMYDLVSNATLDIICLTAFGYRSDSLHNPDNELADAYHKMINLQSGQSLIMFIALVSIPGFQRLFQTDFVYNRRHWFRKFPLCAPAATVLESMRRIRAVATEIVQEKVKNSAITVADKRDVMSLLVQAREADGGKDTISDVDMVEHVLSVLGAGHETTASGLAWTLWLLATHPEAQAKLRAEVSPIVDKNPNPDYRTLKQMEYLDGVVMEGLRVMPPVPLTVRKAAKTDYIDGHLVPKDTFLYIGIRAINTYKPYWGEDAEEFKPERWVNLPPTCNPTLSFQSFICGPHNCIGRAMAIVEMKAVLAVLIANFEFEPAYAGQVAEPTAAITMKPKDGLPLRVRALR